MKILPCIISTFLLLGLSIGILNAENADPIFTPAETKVAVLPVISLTGEQWEKLRQSQIDAVYTESKSLFIKRGFNILDEDIVNTAIADLKVDLTDDSQNYKDSLYQIGQKVGADIVVFVIITDSTQTERQKDPNNIFDDEKEGQVRIRLWIIDIKNNTAFQNGIRYIAKKRELFKVGSTLQVHAAKAAVAIGLNKFLSPYKPVKPVKAQKAH
jgi:hypothetical protein